MSKIALLRHCKPFTLQDVRRTKCFFVNRHTKAFEDKKIESQKRRLLPGKKTKYIIESDYNIYYSTVELITCSIQISSSTLCSCNSLCVLIPETVWECLRLTVCQIFGFCVLSSHRVGRMLSFLCRRIWDSPIPHPQESVSPPPKALVQGGGHSLVGEGLGESQFRRGDIHCGNLYI